MHKRFVRRGMPKLSFDMSRVKPFIKKLEPVWVRVKPYTPFILVAIASFIIGFSFKKVIPVAIVNGDSINRQEFTDLLVKRAGRIVMQEIIINDLISAEAKTRKVKVEGEEIEKQLDIVKRDLKEQNFTLEMYLAQQSVTQKDFEKQIKVQLLIKKMFEPGTKVSEKEIQQFYKDNGIVLGKSAVLRSQRVAIRQAILQQKMRNAYSEWLTRKLQEAEVTHLIKL